MNVSPSTNRDRATSSRPLGGALFVGFVFALAYGMQASRARGEESAISVYLAPATLALELPTGALKSGTIHVINSGSQPAVIQSVVGSCSCLNVGVATGRVNAAGRFAIPFTYKSGSNAGIHRRRIAVTVEGIKSPLVVEILAFHRPGRLSNRSNVSRLPSLESKADSIARETNDPVRPVVGIGFRKRARSLPAPHVSPEVFDFGGEGALRVGVGRRNLIVMS